MKTILTIVKKELKRFFTDPRMLLSLFLPGLLIYGLYSVMGTYVQKSMEPSEYTVYIDNTTVKGSLAGGNYVGGIVGNADTSSGIIEISNCINNATLTGGTTGDICGNAGSVTVIK